MLLDVIKGIQCDDVTQNVQFDYVSSHMLWNRHVTCYLRAMQLHLVQVSACSTWPYIRT